MVVRTVLELNRILCLDLEEVAADKQQIVCLRCFSRRLTGYKELTAALVEFCSRAGEKLRRQQSVTGCVTVFIRNSQEPQYQRSASMKLDAATQDSMLPNILSLANYSKTPKGGSIYLNQW